MTRTKRERERERETAVHNHKPSTIVPSPPAAVINSSISMLSIVSAISVENNISTVFVYKLTSGTLPASRPCLLTEDDSCGVTQHSARNAIQCVAQSPRRDRNCKPFHHCTSARTLNSISAELLAAICWVHRRKLLLGPGAQAPPPLL